MTFTHIRSASVKRVLDSFTKSTNYQIKSFIAHAHRVLWYLHLTQSILSNFVKKKCKFLNNFQWKWKLDFIRVNLFSKKLLNFIRLFEKHFAVLTNNLQTSEGPPLKEYLLVSPKVQITKLKVL
jgi:hypothetical protein